MSPGKTRTSLEVLSTQGNQNGLSKWRSNSTPLLLHYFMLNEERERKILRLLRSQTSLVGAQWAWSCETVGTALTFSNLDIKPCALFPARRRRNEKAPTCITWPISKLKRKLPQREGDKLTLRKLLQREYSLSVHGS